MIKKNWKNLLIKLSNFLLTILFITSALAIQNEKTYRADEAPHPLKNIKVIEKLGKKIELELNFKDENNQPVKLKKYFNSQPVLISIIYYNCPSLCNFHLNGLFTGLKQLALEWNSNYQLVIVSMDDREKADLAKEKKSNYLKEFKGLKKNNIHFLTGTAGNIKKLADDLGFPFYYDDETEQFAHSPVAYTLSQKAMISRYLYGIEFSSKTLKLALLEAGSGKVGNVIDRILLFCYRFNAKENQYTLYAVNIMKVGGVLIILVLLLLLVPVWIRERKKYY